MGQLLCHCGNVISDTVYPCPHAGALRWQPENEDSVQEFVELVDAYFVALNAGKEKEWLRDHFAPEYAAELDWSRGDVIDDIRTKAFDRGHQVLKCTECSRIYVQKEFYSDEWDCYEPRPKPTS
jgi:hypothetical protein